MQILDEVPQGSFRVTPHRADPTRRRYLTPTIIVKPQECTIGGNSECRALLGKHLVRDWRKTSRRTRLGRLRSSNEHRHLFAAQEQPLYTVSTVRGRNKSDTGFKAASSHRWSCLRHQRRRRSPSSPHLSALPTFSRCRRACQMD